jgi:hypothetical protein
MYVQSKRKVKLVSKKEKINHQNMK